MTADLGVLRHLLQAPDEAPRAVATLAEWEPLWGRLVSQWKTPIDRALAGGYAADRPAWAFAAGYQAAVQGLAPVLDDGRIAAVCITEEGGAHPAAIRSRLTGFSDGSREGRLEGTKSFVTGAPEARVLVVAASVGHARDGRNRIRALTVPADRTGITFDPLPGLKLVPEMPHAGVHFTAVRVFESDLLPGDGYTGVVKPFRTLEDIHLTAAVLAWIFGIGRRFGWPAAVREELLALMAALQALALAPTHAIHVHLALGGLLEQVRRLLERTDPLWASVDASVRRWWRRDRPLLALAGAARQRRLERARELSAAVFSAPAETAFEPALHAGEDSEQAFAEAISRVNAMAMEAEVASLEMDQVFNATSDGICVIDKTLTVSRFNRILEEMMAPLGVGMAKGACRHILGHALCGTERCLLTRIFEEGRDRIEEEIEIVSPRGATHTFIVSARPLMDLTADTVGIVESYRDITERKQIEQELRRMAVTDPLTGAFNRRRFLERALEEIERSRRYQTALTLLMIDIDHFKAVNDTFGHDAGDAVLKAMVAESKAQLRGSDIFCRLGGEEFAAILPHTAPEQARLAAERLRKALAGLEVGTARGAVRFTVSIGVASMMSEAASLDRILKKADDALYEAKQQGRDCVVIAPDLKPVHQNCRECETIVFSPASPGGRRD